MHRALRHAAQLDEDAGFLAFQNDLTKAAYTALGQTGKSHAHEVATVTRLVEAVNGKTYERGATDGKISIAAKKIHGTTSYVEFKYRGTPATKELGDMVVITTVTSGAERLLQRVCIIQNKKARGGKWGIDPEQLFLLKNFPPFAGKRGLFRGMNDVLFRNRSGCLGAYGLFHEPGEMIFLAAPLFAEILRGRKSVGIDAVSLPSLLPYHSLHAAFPVTPFGHLIDPADWFIIMQELVPPARWPRWRDMGLGLPFLGNVHYGRDIFDFIRAWTQLNLGEYTRIGDTTTNSALDAFANRLMRIAGLDAGIDLPPDNLNPDDNPEGDAAVFLLRMDVGHDKQ